MIIKALNYTELFQRYDTFLEDVVKSMKKPKICDIGGGRNPRFSPEFVKSAEIQYTLLDISKRELERAPASYNKFHGDVSNPEINLPDQFDLCFSRMVAEHIKNGDQFHKNIYRMLAPGGYVVHFHPTFICLPFIVNRLLPERAASKLLDIVRPRDRNLQGKFPAYYSRCHGSTAGQIKFFENLGYNVVCIYNGFGHSYYDRIPAVNKFSRRFFNFLQKRNMYAFSSYAITVLRKGDGKANIDTSVLMNSM